MRIFKTDSTAKLRSLTESELATKVTWYFATNAKDFTDAVLGGGGEGGTSMGWWCPGHTEIASAFAIAFAFPKTEAQSSGVHEFALLVWLPPLKCTAATMDRARDASATRIASRSVWPGLYTLVGGFPLVGGGKFNMSGRGWHFGGEEGEVNFFGGVTLWCRDNILVGVITLVGITFLDNILTGDGGGGVTLFIEDLQTLVMARLKTIMPLASFQVTGLVKGRMTTMSSKRWSINTKYWAFLWRRNRNNVPKNFCVYPLKPVASADKLQRNSEEHYFVSPPDKSPIFCLLSLQKKTVSTHIFLVNLLRKILCYHTV